MQSNLKIQTLVEVSSEQNPCKSLLPVLVMAFSYKVRFGLERREGRKENGHQDTSSFYF